jgi:hypothetical protein
MNFIERWFRQRALRREDVVEEQLPAALQAVPVGTVIGINGFNFRVVHRRCGRRGKNPGLVLAPIGPTRKHLKARRQDLRRMLRLVSRPA